MGISSTLKGSPGLQTAKTCLSKPPVHKRLTSRRLPISKRRPRIVRFDLDANKVKETSRISRESKDSLFWTTLEREGIQETNQRLALQFIRQQPLCAEKASLVFDRCCQDCISDDSSSSSSSEEEEDENCNNDHDQDDSDDILEIQDTLDAAKTIAIEVPAHVRGLEWGFLPASKQYRQTHIQRVLRWQRCLGRNQPKLLSSRTIRSSRPSRALARIMGASDEINAKDTLDVRRNRYRMLPTWW